MVERNAMARTMSVISLILCFVAGPMLPLTIACSAQRMDKTGLEASVQTLARAYLASRANTALSIGITYEGKSHYFNFGAVDAKTGQPPTRASVYEIGSITKTFTGLILAQAIAEN